MKNIEQILKDAGVEITEEQKTAINAGVNENYRTLSDYQKQKKKLTDTETERDSLKEQLTDAQETLKGFDGVDVKKWQDDLAAYQKRAEDAEANMQKGLMERDQKEYLKTEFDRLGIKSERMRNSLMKEIMSDDGLKWKDGKYMGLSDYLAAENEKDHFYQTQEQKELEEKQQQAAAKVPKFTDVSSGKTTKSEDQNPFGFNFTPLREIKK